MVFNLKLNDDTVVLNAIKFAESVVYHSKDTIKGEEEIIR